ncbi:MAG: hypothetical protein JJ866_15830 [Roseibium sp.]|uniref:hypothetical protein n=1 Tax=Roseibium sp. TaxID=1936156 RepID=UPI001B06E6D2|nr:hypothetical protein [Roseibium sp.]MBO6893413.1 hypothetical protein [Roseibium sp.]MBO6930620.1 hypothetical protein [Roseibium sp.]
MNDNVLFDAVYDTSTELGDERARQITDECFTPEGDDAHVSGELALAAAAYLLKGTRAERTKSVCLRQRGGGQETFDVPEPWPHGWDPRWFRPGDRRRNLVKAGALIIAEIERLDRATAVTKPVDAVALVDDAGGGQ